jgi:hypothetical protein
MKNDFNNLNWHDAELKSIHIDRSDPGKKDQVVLVICWPNDKISEMTFHDCYAFKAQLNFGIIAEETIRDAEYTESSKELNEIRRSWDNIGADLSDLGQYQIETNSTNSSLIIYARGVWIKDI